MRGLRGPGGSDRSGRDEKARMRKLVGRMMRSHLDCQESEEGRVVGGGVWKRRGRHEQKGRIKRNGRIRKTGEG